MATFQKRSGKWQAIIRRKGVRQTKTFDLKSAAQAWARKREMEIDGLAPGVTPAEGTLGQLIDRYKAEIGPLKNWSPNKEARLARLRRDLGHVRVRDLTSGRIIDYLRGRGIGPSTVAADLSYLGTVLKTARTLWRMEVPPLVVEDARHALSTAGLSGASEKRDRRVPDEEIASLKAFWRSEVPCEILDFAVLTCMRVGEITRICWEDVNHDRRTVVIRQRKHPTRKKSNDQEVPLLGHSYDLACDQWARLGGGETGCIWPYPVDTVGAAFRRAAREARLEDIRFHDLRHEGISRLADRGWSIPQISKVSGHVSLASLSRYTHVDAASLHALG